MNSAQDSTATQKSLFARYQEHITSAIFIGLVLGILTGLFLASRFDVVLTVTTLLGSIYMNALNMMIFPLVFCSIVVGITSIGNAKTTGKITGGAMIFFLFTTALASFVGLIIPRAINLGKGVRFEMATSDIEASKMTSISDKITSIAIPLGATVNMDAVSIVLSFMIVFFANACGVEVSTSMMIVILLANVILSVGTPGIPGGAIASFAALATMAGLPAGVMGVYISINTLCDMGATCVNVIGDMAGCVVLKEKIKLDD